MKTDVTIIKELFLSHIEKKFSFNAEQNFMVSRKEKPLNVEQNDSDYWKKLAVDLVDYENDPKPVYEAVYRLEPEDPERMIKKLPRLYKIYLEELAEQYVLGNEFPPTTRLLKEKNASFLGDVVFFRELKNAATTLERTRMIKNMPSTYAALSEEISEEDIQTAVKKKGREELLAKFKAWDQEMEVEKTSEESAVEEAKVVPSAQAEEEEQELPTLQTAKPKPGIYSYSWLYAVAAILLIGFFIWQPTQKSNEELFNSYAGSQQVISKIDFSELGDTENAVVTRGGEYRLPGLTQNESEKALEAINYIRQQEFYKAKNILEQLAPEEKNAEVLFFLALTQLNTGEIERAVENLKVLSKRRDNILQKESQFQLALGYLAQDDKASAKKLLRKLEEDQGKYSGEASAILKDMKWF
ncbi:hypothetical protein [Christiangramia sp.]|uniref:tetratricopeptide repeat protein n=1 Tax=Christiangramia sp. TaxID=1931228 RepID=UPI0026183BAA|nr:hypothetical protein [Christiangramia sp.]